MALKSRVPAVPLLLLLVLAAASSLLPAVAGAAASGDRLWTRTAPATPGRDNVDAVVPAPSGGVYAVGQKGMAGGGEGRVLWVSRISSSGKVVWSHTYSCSRSHPEAVQAFAAVDQKGNLIASCAMRNPGHGMDVVVAKYTPSGDLVWVRPFDDPLQGHDYPYGLGVDTRNSIYVAARMRAQDGGLRYTELKLRPSNGTTVWRFTQPSELGRDFVADLAVTSSGTSYLTGTSRYTVPRSTDTSDCALTVRVSTLGQRVWAMRQTSPYGPVTGTDVVLTDSGGCRVAGDYTTSTTQDVMVLTYTADGVGLGQALIDFHQGSNQASGLAASPDGGSVVSCGSSLAKVISAGLVAWTATFGSGAEFEDVRCGPDDSVYATGYQGNPGVASDVLTVKYTSSGGLGWSNAYTDVGLSWSHSLAITQTAVYAGGFVGRNLNDGLTIRYVP